MHYKGSQKDVAEISRELGVDYVVEGSVHRDDVRIALNVQLIQGHNQTHLWAKRYDIELRDLFDTRSAIAQAIATQIDITPRRDSSVIVRRLLRHSGALTELADWALVASELLEVEVLRALYRIHAEGLMTHEELGARIAELQAIVAAVDQVPITKLVLKRAGGPLAGILKTLDAIHLVTALSDSPAHARPPTGDGGAGQRPSGSHPWPMGA